MTALAHQFNQTTTGMVVLGMGFKMIGEITDPFAQDGHLNFR